VYLWPANRRATGGEDQRLEAGFSPPDGGR
jgi:hypothetical protein